MSLALSDNQSICTAIAVPGAWSESSMVERMFASFNLGMSEEDCMADKFNMNRRTFVKGSLAASALAALAACSGGNGRYYFVAYFKYPG